MPDRNPQGKIDGKKIGALLLKLLQAALTIAPLFAAGQATEDVAEIEAGLTAYLSGPDVADGQFGGPITDAAIAKAIRGLLAMAETNADAAAALLGRVIERVSPFPLP